MERDRVGNKGTTLLRCRGEKDERFEGINKGIKTSSRVESQGEMGNEFLKEFLKEFHSRNPLGNPLLLVPLGLTL